MSKSQSLFSRTFSKLARPQERRQSRRRRPSRRLRTEALEARQLLAGDLFINEIMASNATTIEDPNEAGAFEDWVEIYNAGTTVADLGGMYLTDDFNAPMQWQFPAGSTVAAGDYLLIWADKDTDQGDAHAGFKLSASGEAVALYDTDGTTLVDSIEFGAQVTDVSYGRSPDGSQTLSVLTTPTPGTANSVVGDANFAPTANAGGPYFGTTADTLSLSGSSSSDDDGTIATYEWDLDHDGLYGGTNDATGETVNFSSATVGTFVVSLRVTDDDGATSEDTGTIKISQVGDVATAWDPVTIDDEAAAFFDDTYVHEVHITFEDADWYNALFTSHDTDASDPYFEADVVADGIAVDGVGVRFKGNSSFSGSGVKKSIKIDFNEFEDLTFMGLKKLNLNNNYNDPTMLREKLFYDYASNFVEGVSRSVHTKVYINGSYYGLYTAVEQVDSTFTQSRFGDDEDGNLYKGTASDEAVLNDPSADFGSDLTYLGVDADQADYEAFYDLKTNEAANDYSQLIELIDVLNNTPAADLSSAIEPLLDVSDTLAGLALNNLFANLDSYSGAAHNYYLYELDDTGQFTHVLWDVNESFGTFDRFLERGQNIVELDPLFLPIGTERPGTPPEDEPRPLAENLWAVDHYQTDYLRDLQQMLDESFDVTSATARINELADLIRADVSADPNKQFTLAQFNSNLTTNVNAGNRTVYGLTSFIQDRSTYLATALTSYDLEPESVEVYINEVMADNDTTIEDPEEAGAFEDWIELYNPGAASVDLSGFYLTDDAADPTQWRFSTGSTIEAGGHLVIWADGDTDQGDDHAAFKLSAGGESVLLYNNDGATLVDSITFGDQASDVSYGRFPDGSATLDFLSEATPGAANTNADLDYGDAPDSYSTGLADNGARHAAAGPQLGPSRDTEADGASSNAADGDGNDEDGALFGGIGVNSSIAAVNILLSGASEAKVDAWVDFNRDGVWDDSEKIIDNVEITESMQTLNYDVPAGLTSGDAYARVRLSSTGGLSPTGFAPDGEVEDFVVSIGEPPVVESITINGDDDQRSSLTSVELTFDKVVKIDEVGGNAFTFTHDDSEETVSHVAAIDNSSGKTVVSFTFDPSDPRVTSFGSLENGDFKLTIDASRVSYSGIELGDGDGSTGDDWVMSAADGLFRKYGDQTGDGSVGLSDFAAFRQTFGLSDGVDGYLDELDSNGDNEIGLTDFAAFRSSFGS